MVCPGKVRNLRAVPWGGIAGGASEPHMDRWGGGRLLLDFGRADLRLVQLPVYTRGALHPAKDVCLSKN